MKKFKNLFSILLFCCLFCEPSTEIAVKSNYCRMPIDTVGFAHTASQMDSILSRINKTNQQERQNIFYLHRIDSTMNWRLVICPHDDYSYAGEMYPYVLKNLRTPLVILFGVAHKAKLFKIEDKIVFDSFQCWQGPYGQISVSPLREELVAALPVEFYKTSDSLQQAEHSVEALLPFLQVYQPDIEIISILVPYMNFSRIEAISQALARAIKKISQEHQLIWGKDFAFAISNDAVHYGDEDWGGKNFAPFGADSAGYQSALDYEMNIISECLIDRLDPQGIQRFFEYTVSPKDYKEYSWTWCGRYSVPFGLLTAYNLQDLLSAEPLTGIMLCYSTSISHPPLEVKDLKMGITAQANIRHWVGYVSIGYR
jgi:AmmeMemoRadiSam system protein B